MADKNQELLTQEGFEKLQEEFRYLTEARRREVADRIRQAREFGDISENSEYDDAKTEQGLLERRISEVQRRLRSAKVVDRSEEHTSELQSRQYLVCRLLLEKN